MDIPRDSSRSRLGLFSCLPRAAALGLLHAGTQRQKLEGHLRLMFSHMTGDLGVQQTVAHHWRLRRSCLTANDLGFRRTRVQAATRTSELQSPYELVCRLLLE